MSVRDRKSPFQRDDLDYRSVGDCTDLPVRILKNKQHFVDAGWMLPTI